MHPEKGKVVVANDIAAANALDADWISVKNAHRVLVWLKHSGTNDTDLVLKLQEAKPWQQTPAVWGLAAHESGAGGTALSLPI